MVCLSEGMTLTINLKIAIINDNSYRSTETIVGTNGDDLILWRGGPNDLIDGMSGTDILSINASSKTFEVRTLDSGATYLVGIDAGFADNEGHNAILVGIETVEFSDKTITIGEDSGGADEVEWNEIFGTKKDDQLIGTSEADYLSGRRGDDILSGGAGDDLIMGGKGFDILSGGSGEDWFAVTKKEGKGKSNWDYIDDFEVGEDVIMVHGSTKKLWIDEFEGDAVLVRGKKDIIAWVEGAGGQLDWGGQ